LCPAGCLLDCKTFDSRFREKHLSHVLPGRINLSKPFPANVYLSMIPLVSSQCGTLISFSQAVKPSEGMSVNISVSSY
jgi:hypothetical protein